jgi:hypothetical protein
MTLVTKGFWAEEIIDATSLSRLQKDFAATGANLLCIRTDSPYIEQLITQLHGQNPKARVYGWRWPHAKPNNSGPTGDSSYAPNEMNKVIGLIGKGLDGYIFDIESEGDGAANDWDENGPANRQQVATAMVKGIADAFRARGTPYTLGLTSHQWGFSNYPHVPWQAFLDECTALFPQTYWRFDAGNGAVKKCEIEAKNYSTGKTIGTPDQALFNGFTDYANKQDKNGKILPIFPVGGEVGCAVYGEMAHFAQLVAQRNVNEAHFYVDVDHPGWISAQQPNDPRVMTEIANIQVAAGGLA